MPSPVVNVTVKLCVHETLPIRPISADVAQAATATSRSLDQISNCAEASLSNEMPSNSDQVALRTLFINSDVPIG